LSSLVQRLNNAYRAPGFHGELSVPTPVYSPGSTYPERVDGILLGKADKELNLGIERNLDPKSQLY